MVSWSLYELKFINAVISWFQANIRNNYSPENEQFYDLLDYPAIIPLDFQKMLFPHVKDLIYQHYIRGLQVS